MAFKLKFNKKVGFCLDRKKHSLLRDKYFCEDSRICYLHWKSLNMCSEWGNIKECNKYPQTGWPVNDEPLNTLETIVLNFLLRSKIHHSWFLLICKMYHCFIPK